MITAEYCQTMASYNAWQNKSLSRCVKALSMKELQKDRGAFFGSIWGTANHLMWGDQLWMSRFDGGHGPSVEATDHDKLHTDKQLWLDDRMRTDQRIIRWAGRVKQIDLIGPLLWYSPMLNKTITKPTALCIMHFFNHQTHHRGQLHAMLTDAGQKPDDTDLTLMPE